VRVKFFDANCRIGRGNRPAPGGIESADDLLRELDEFGIERALVHGTEAKLYDPVVGNKLLMQDVAAFDRLEPCWVAPPPDARGPLDVAEYMDGAVQAGVRAVRVYNAAEISYGYPLNEWMTGDLLGAMNDHRMPLFIEALSSPWAEVRQMCLRYPNIPVVSVRPKYREMRWIYAFLDGLPNFHFTFDLFAVHRVLEDVCNRFGPERMIFATHLPEFSPAVPIGMVMYANISDDDKALIASGNLERLLGGVK
jgi:hypothetical protein